MKLEKLSSRDRDAAARVLIDSFRDYPYMRFILRASGVDYEQNLEALILFILDARWARRHPVLGLADDNGLLAVATVVDPAPVEPSPEVERLFAQLESTLGKDASELMSVYEEATQGLRPQEAFHYLGMLGVLPGQQGKGLGGDLVEAVKALARCDDSSTGVCLTTETATNVSLYEHLGFEVVGEVDFDGMHTWCMFWHREEAS